VRRLAFFGPPEARRHHGASGCTRFSIAAGGRRIVSFADGRFQASDGLGWSATFSRREVIERLPARPQSAMSAIRPPAAHHAHGQPLLPNSTPADLPSPITATRQRADLAPRGWCGAADDAVDHTTPEVILDWSRNTAAAATTA